MCVCVSCKLCGEGKALFHADDELVGSNMNRNVWKLRLAPDAFRLQSGAGCVTAIWDAHKSVTLIIEEWVFITNPCALWDITHPHNFHSCAIMQFVCMKTSMTIQRMLRSQPNWNLKSKMALSIKNKSFALIACQLLLLPWHSGLDSFYTFRSWKKCKLECNNYPH